MQNRIKQILGLSQLNVGLPIQTQTDLLLTSLFFLAELDGQDETRVASISVSEGALTNFCHDESKKYPNVFTGFVFKNIGNRIYCKAVSNFLMRLKCSAIKLVVQREDNFIINVGPVFRVYSKFFLLKLDAVTYTDLEVIALDLKGHIRDSVFTC